MEEESIHKTLTQRKSAFYSTKLIIWVLLLLPLVLIIFRTEASPFDSSSSASWVFFNKWRGMVLDANQILVTPTKPTF
ncbi:hypothetical protein SLA2020_336130 [Shorea laevis]